MTYTKSYFSAFKKIFVVLAVVNLILTFLEGGPFSTYLIYMSFFAGIGGPLSLVLNRKTA